MNSKIKAIISLLEKYTNKKVVLKEFEIIQKESFDTDFEVLRKSVQDSKGFFNEDEKDEAIASLENVQYLAKELIEKIKNEQG